MAGGDDIIDYLALFRAGRPMLDVRAPVEFDKGAFPGAVNLPLMNDSEREQVGLCYKQQGQQAAIALGHRLVGGEIKARRVQAWTDFARANPDGCLYCFRGGLRSQIARQWLREAGIIYPRVAGGYKALRGFLLETVDQAVAQCDFVVVGGMTGAGKTDVIVQLDNGLDLEGHANHRGSSFGKRATAQPSGIDFENRLGVDLLKKRAHGIRQFVLEDESRLIGRCALPLPLYQGMQAYPLVWLEEGFDDRVERILRDYVVALAAEYRALHGANGDALFGKHLLLALDKLYKRLGGERHQRIVAILEAALAEQAHGGSGAVDLHRDWIGILLREYYDPIYIHQLESKTARIEFAGEQAAVIDYLKQRCRPC
jgi:tRNA 2-selenouridine synthase